MHLILKSLHSILVGLFVERTCEPRLKWMAEWQSSKWLVLSAVTLPLCPEGACSAMILFYLLSVSLLCFPSVPNLTSDLFNLQPTFNPNIQTIHTVPSNNNAWGGEGHKNTYWHMRAHAHTHTLYSWRLVLYLKWRQVHWADCDGQESVTAGHK